MACSSCLSGAFNTGTLSKTAQGQPVMNVYVPIIADDGTPNRLELGQGSGPNGAYTIQDIRAFINHPDPSKRWYPSGFMRSMLVERAESAFQTYDDDSRAKLRIGLKTFTGLRVDEDSKHLLKYENLFCKFEGNMGKLMIDVCDNIHGEGFPGDQDPYLYPVPIATDSFDFTLVPASNSERVAVRHKFDYERFSDDKNLCMFRAGFPGELAPGTILQRLNGLVDIVPLNDSTGNPVVTSDVPSQTIELVVVAEYGGTAGQPVNLPADAYEFTNETQSTTIVPDSVEYGLDGTALFTFPVGSFVAADVLKLGLNSATQGFSVEQWEEIDIIV